MLMSTPNRFRHALEKLAAEPPSTKTALMRSLLSEIEAALASGKTWKQVWQCLADDGLDISYEAFRKVLQRVRKKARISAPPGAKASEFPTTAHETADRLARDPLANLKRLDENRPGFHWRATPRLKGSDAKKGGCVKKPMMIGAAERLGCRASLPRKTGGRQRGPAFPVVKIVWRGVWKLCCHRGNG